MPMSRANAMRSSLAAVFAALAFLFAASSAQAEHAGTIVAGQQCPADAANHNCNNKTDGSFICRRATDVASTLTCMAKPQSGPEVLSADAGPKFTPTVPLLSIPIPNVTLTAEQATGGLFKANFIAQYVTGVYKFAVGIASVIAAVMMMIGGFKWLTAGGDAGRVTAAKENIKNALIGLALSLGAYVILYTVNPDLVEFKGLDIQVVQRIDYVENETLPEDQPETEPRTAATAGNNNVPYLNQGSYADVPYKSSVHEPVCETQPDGTKYTIKSSGCGITSASMVIAYQTGLGGSEAANLPPKLAELAHKTKEARDCNPPTCSKCNGTSFAAFKPALEDEYDVKVTFPGTDRKRIIKLLQQGKPLIANVGPSLFTKGGHYIVLTGVSSDEKTIAVNDPGRRPSRPYDCDRSNPTKCPNLPGGQTIPHDAVPVDYVFGPLKSTVLIVED
jgi:hypothetical protein